MNKPRVVESVTNECQSLGRAHESSSARAEQLIACLEGEIAKRDETIARLEPQLNRAIQANYDLREELAACRIAAENCDLFRARIAELEADRDSHQHCATQAMAELAAIKAQGVVMPDVNAAAKALCNRHAIICGVDADDQWKEYSQDFIADAETVLANARLNAAPVQQVSVPDGWRELAKRADDFLYSLPETDSVLRLRADLCTMLSAPAAPAADASDVLDQAMYTLISIGYHENSGLVHELRQAIAARRAKVVQ